MRERRFVKGAEVRATDNGHIEGHAAVFNQEYVMWDTPSFRVVEVIKPGAFARALREKQDVRALYNHDASNILGRTKSNTLAMEENQRGLHFDCTPPETQLGRDVRTLIKRGDITGCSFAFTVKKQERTEEEIDGKVHVRREIQDVDLYDVGPVTYPAYEGTDVKARSVELRGLFPDGVPEGIKDKLPPELRDAADGDGDVEDTPSDPGDGNGPDDEPDDDEDEGYRMDASLMADHYQAKAEHHEAMAKMHQEMAASHRSAHDGMEDELMKEHMKRMARAHQAESDAHADLAEHYRDMQDCAYADYEDGERSARPAKEQREKKTKRVAGEDLPASAFAYVGDAQKTETWKLPIKFASVEKTKRHIRNALARFNQTQGIPASEKPKVLAKIKAAARKYGIDVSDDEKKSLPLVDLKQAKAYSETLLAETSL